MHKFDTEQSLKQQQQIRGPALIQTYLFDLFVTQKFDIQMTGQISLHFYGSCKRENQRELQPFCKCGVVCHAYKLCMYNVCNFFST